MDAQETVHELRRVSLEIKACEKQLEELRRRHDELLEIGSPRPNRRSILDREGRQRFLAGCGSAKRSQPA
jgi:hypothetical protein